MARRNLIVFLLLISIPQISVGMSENQRIKYLLEEIVKSHLVFIRNGKEYSAQKAKDHLEMKLANAGGYIKTAEQFIEYIASKSSFSGRYYYIKLKNGKRIKAGVWLRKQLKELDRKKAH